MLVHRECEMLVDYSKTLPHEVCVTSKFGKKMFSSSFIRFTLVKSRWEVHGES